MKSILIVDDDPSVRRMLELTFRAAGFATHTAANGAEALRTLDETPCDLIILDMVMPEKEGIETLLQLKERTPCPGIIAISGGARFGLTGEVRLDAHQALRLADRLGAARSFSKPLDNDELVAVARELTASEP